MRLVATKTIHEGTELAKAIYSDTGRVLIQKDMKLTNKMIQRLQQLGITYVYIKDALTDDIIIKPPIPDELRLEAVQIVKNSFADLQTNGYQKHAYIFSRVSEKMSKIVSHIIDEIKNQEEVLSILSDVIISDDYIFSHSINVTVYALALATELGLPQQKLEHIGLGSMLHDVGKVSIPEGILQKKERLTDYEYEIIKTHTVEGFNMLRKSGTIPLLVAHCAYQHHERLDGSGYPRGIVGQDIHFYGKLLAVADVFDAVTSNRVYRDALLPHEGLEILYSGSGRLFDQDLVHAFRKTIAVYPNGITVGLSDGRSGIVVKQNKHLLERPVVRIVKEFGEEIIPYDVDLSNLLNVTITSCHSTLENSLK
ncbi:HD-GYP domain-containing protein [Aquibacillus salsiterrae]|uniref:HD-GYP domain-containing protein n=1 Tax=Aquibacillus salsiterrae TaxID=2950439 RepID=A0A9X4AH74_9BACI|nr:HD-GYP domain-containing protein [Aquibacillus salsiterrae]MDC3417878.1 HD-GYP domain-containing protein [Aquibacillus salsiterrae]